MNEIKEKYLKMAMKHGAMPRQGVTEFHIAEMLDIKEKSLWYTQVKGWITNPPDIKDPKVKEIFKKASEIFIESVDNDYKIPDKYNALAVALVSDLVNMTTQLRNNSLYVVSQWIPIIAKIILQNSKSKVKELTNAVSKEQKCLHPECNEIIDLAKKKSGVCCIEHSRYFCRECKCWHHHGTKIATEHYKYKVTDWIKDKNKREEVLKDI